MAKKLTFQGGTAVLEHKHTQKNRIEKMSPPAQLIIPMKLHIGAPCIPMVNVGDIVEKGQQIAECPPFALGAPIHSPVSGKVSAIEDRKGPDGTLVSHIILENDGEDRLYSGMKPFGKRLLDTTTEEIAEIVRSAGIVGMGGAGFPTHAKITSSAGKAKTVIINCAECEPFITANHRLLLEHPERVINGLKILLKALGLREGIIAVEDNKLDAINKLEELLGDSLLITVKILKTKYPQGDERQLIYALTGKCIPVGKLPLDVGCVVFNCDTAAAIFSAFSKGFPLTERIVTVDGDCVREPKNVLVPIGTKISDVLEFCGGLLHRPYKVIIGGPMMGQAVWDIDLPVTKTTTAILVFSSEFGEMYAKPQSCIRCGKCAGVCPMHLVPSYLASYARNANYEMCETFDAMACMECGSCAYSCPANIPLVQYIRSAKAILREQAASRAKEEKEKQKEKGKEETAQAEQNGGKNQTAAESSDTKASGKNLLSVLGNMFRNSKNTPEQPGKDKAKDTSANKNNSDKTESPDTETVRENLNSVTGDKGKTPDGEKEAPINTGKEEPSDGNENGNKNSDQTRTNPGTGKFSGDHKRRKKK